MPSACIGDRILVWIETYNVLACHKARVVSDVVAGVEAEAEAARFLDHSQSYYFPQYVGCSGNPLRRRRFR